MAPTLTGLPGSILAEILLRLPAPEDLARASAACPAFRRVATDGSFMRRFRRIHAPQLLAFIDLDGFQPALPPHPSAPAARALAAAADFSFSFLPSHIPWIPMDVRDGRVLLGRDHGQVLRRPVFRELAVCDPLHRRYVLLPPVPDALAASVERPPSVLRGPCDEPFLLPLGENDAAAGEGTAFAVICMVHCETKMAPFVFSSSTGQWRAAAPLLWSAMPVSAMDPTQLRRHYAYGCFYWDSTLGKRKELLVMNAQSMEFSIAELPSRGWGTPLGVAIVEAGEGRLGLFGIRDGTAGGKPELCYTVRRNKGRNSGQWQMVKTFSLGSGCLHYIKAATERYVLLVVLSKAPRFVGLSMEMSDLEYISVDVKKLQLERVCVKPFGNSLSRTRIYAHFPPSLSSPTI